MASSTSSSSKSGLASLLAAPFVAPALFAGAALGVGAVVRAAQAAPAKPKLRLVYWPARGIMETARMMCGIAGASVSDERLGGTPEGALSESNLGRMPVLVTPEGKSIGQSIAINYYVAETYGFLGKDAAEAAAILSFAEHFRELNEAWGKLVPYGTAPTDESFAAFFDEAAAPDFAGVAVRNTKRGFPWFVRRMEGLVGKGGFAVGSAISLADVLIFRHLADVVPVDAVNEKEASHRRVPFSSAAKVNAALAACPKIKAIIANVAANANMKKYLAARPKHC